MVPSTEMFRPVGELVMVCRPVKPAVTDCGAFMVTFCGVVVPLSAPLKPEKK